MAIVNSDKWEDALRNCTVVDARGKCTRILCCCNKKGKSNDPETSNDRDNAASDNDSVDVANKFKTQFTTPMRVIIRKMPG